MIGKFRSTVLLILLFISHSLVSVGPIVPGQSLWCITKEIGSTIDVVESKFCALDLDVSLQEAILCSKLEILQSITEEISSKSEVIESKVMFLAQCAPTPITAPTTITAEGFYCVAPAATNSTNSITIQSDDVVVDVNGQRVQGFVVEGYDQITIYHGWIVGNGTGNGVEVQLGASNVTLRDLQIQQAEIGAELTGVAGGLIENCEFSSNVTGVELSNSYKIVIDNSVASCNRNAGFCLLSSTTNTITNCKALSTGDGNTSTSNQTIFGFVSSDGYGNVFENCVANGTQGLSVTDFSSLVAGFALRGSEGCSKIISNESANAQVSASGVTIPYGILLEGTIGSSLTLTALPLINQPTSAVNSLDWSVDDKYLAVADGSTLRIYEYDSVDKVLSQLVSIGATSTIDKVRWDASGMFAATVEDNGTLNVYQLCKTNNTIDLVVTATTDSNLNTLSWNPAGTYIATGGNAGNPEVRVFSFDRAATTLSFIASSGAPTANVTDVAWSPDGNFLATVSDIIRVYPFSSNTFGTVVTNSPGGGTLSSIDWSPDGTFFATVESGGTLRFFEFNNSTPSIVVEDTFAVSGSPDLNSVNWSDDGRYVTIGGDDAITRVISWGRSTAPVQVSLSAAAAGNVNEVRWSPDGQLIASAIENASDPIAIYMALTFPHKNVIKDNLVYCNGGDRYPEGIGISGSSILNLIIGNTAYANPVMPNMVGQNYAFVQNVFNPLFGIGPSLTQNISVDCNQVLTAPPDMVALIKQAKSVIMSVNSQLDIVESKLCGLTSDIDMLGGCDPTPFFASTTISLPGYYCLADDNNVGTINVTSDNVVVDLNGHRVQSVVIEGTDQVTFEHGTIVGDSMTGIGLQAQAGSSNITLRDLNIQQAEVGISFDQVTGGLIDACEVSSNFTGVELTQSYKIIINDTIARCNKNAGFCLISSATNIIQDSQALSTGEGNNNVTDQTIVGFVSTDGYGNIFERCIANGTQALTTTDAASLVAGFALRGSEGCTKIIDSESANTQVGITSVTIPYGIVLEATVNSSLTLTALPLVGQQSNPVVSLDWTPDGTKLLAASGDTDYIYSFDSQQYIFTQITADSTATSTAVRWSPDGEFYAAGDIDDTLRVYQFCNANNSVELVASIASTDITSVDWAPAANYIATGNATSNELNVYSFNRGFPTLALVDSDASSSSAVLSVGWAPNGGYIATANAGGTLEIFSFISSTLASVASDSSATGPIRSLSWSPDGLFIATGGDDQFLRIYRFNNASDSLSLVAISAAVSGDINSVQWSSDSRYVAVGTADADNTVYLFSFDRDSSVTQVSSSAAASGSVYEVRWTPDGRLITAGINDAASPINVYEALTFPHKNVIKDNTVYCNGGGLYPSGFGISGSSIANLIIGNTAYANPMDFALVGTNYAFVTNVFNQLFGIGPSLLQNISVDACVPLIAPEDLALILKQAKAKFVQVESQLEVIESKLSLTATGFDVLKECMPTPFTASTTITESGYYCLSEENDFGVVTVQSNVNDVFIDLNGYRIQGVVIEENNNHITVDHGTVRGVFMIGTGVEVQSGCSDITLSNLRVQNAGTGILLTSVGGGLISNCEMSTNVTGVEIDQSYKINIEDSIASCNKSSGFSLMSSTTNCFINCKALSNGEGNTNTSGQEIFGFVSQDGYGNIFEQCIANGTGNSQITDFDSIIAGFALRGSEGCTKIIECEAANSTAGGVNIPYGILLEGTVDSTLSLTGVPPNPSVSGAQVLAWSADQNYLAIGLNASPYIRVYEFDNVNRIFTQVATPDISPGATVTSIDWSPDGTFLAVSGASIVGDILIYQFCRTTYALEQVQTAASLSSVASVNAIRWSPSGSYLVLGQAAGSEVQVLLFDRASYALTLAASSTTPSAAVTAVDWSPDETEVVVVYGTTVALFGFIPNTTTLTTHGTGTIGASPTAVRWSPDGDYIATGDSVGVEVFQFNAGSSPTLTQRATSALANTKSVDWSDDSRYIVASHNAAAAVQVYQFDRTGSTTLESIATPGSPGTSTLSTVRWSPDGSLIALASDISGLNFAVYDAIAFPSKNVIKDNTVYCNSAGSFPTGIGISGSSVKNLIIQNTAYANPTTAPVIGTNYAFVQNVFNQLFGQGPSLLQNISVDGCVPMISPEDLVLILKQARMKAFSIDSQLDIVLSKVCEISSVIDSITSCNPTPITATTSTTVSVQGFYCVANNMSGTLTINASDVVVDMNGRNIAGLAIDAADQVRVYHGTVDGTGVLVTSATNISLEDIKAQNAEIGIDLINVVGAQLINCDMSSNVTGVELNQSHKIVLDSCTARCNTNAGFCLLSSTTNCLKDCRSLSTGDGNTNATNQTIFGFVATDGYANIFENCIANGTQGLQVTDSDSLVAGFALRGSEGCTKIIGCESANAQTSASGVTMPFGILLEGSLGSSLTLTALPANPNTVGASAVAWSPDQKDLAVTFTLSPYLRVYEYDNVNYTLVQVATPDVALTNGGGSIDWSPDGSFVAVAGVNDEIVIYQWCSRTLMLQKVADASALGLNDVNDIRWSPNGTYLLIGQSGSPELQVLLFDRAATTLSLEASSSVPTDPVTGVDWSPDGTEVVAVDGTAVRLFGFTPNNSTLTAHGNATSGQAFSVRWSPDGKYIAAGTAGTASLDIYAYNGTGTPSITQVASDPTSEIRSIDWSSDSKYVVASYDDATGMRVFYFDRGTPALTLVATPQATPGASDGSDVRWSPDGTLIVRAAANSSLEFGVYEAISFPQKNVIKDNIVYCNSGSSGPCGIGISGSSIKNLIIGNTCYANPMMPPVVGTNYAFVQNVFNQLFGIAPSLLQNISIDGCVPLTTPPDIVIPLKQDKSLIDAIIASLAEAQSRLDASLTKIELVTSCNALPFTASTTITAPGFYCLAANNDAGVITVQSDNVAVDLNGHHVLSVVIEDHNSVTFSNGRVIGSNMTGTAIDVQAGASNVTLRDIKVQSAQVGIKLTGVIGGIIDNCEMSLNVTGVELTSCINIAIDSSTASCNKNAGFSLVSSTTNSVIGCKALSTGEGNTQTSNQTIFGFVSQDGLSNIFENCIANGTQGLSVTDLDSLIVGFALRGDEGCSKIINCESSNAQTSANGVTIPYGILIEGTISSNLTQTAVPPIPEPSAAVVSLDWRPDGRQLILSAGSTLYLYAFDPVNFLLSQVLTDNTATSVQVRWSADSQYVATADSDNMLRVYEWCGKSSTLEVVDAISSANLTSVAWSPSAQFIAVGSSSGNELRVYEFNRITQTLSLIDSTGNPATTVNEVVWSPDGGYIAVVTAGGNLEVYPFVAGSIGSVVSVAIGTAQNSVDWSPDGLFVAVGGDDDILRVYQFVSSTNSLNLIASSSSIGSDINSVMWSDDSLYVAVGTGTTNNSVRVYYFDRVSAVTLVASSSTLSAEVNELRWTPDGRYISAGVASASDPFANYTALEFPSKNVITDNIVYCNSGSKYPTGIGISGSSIANLIISNTSYANPIMPQLVGTNYAFVQNVFNQLFGIGPSPLQNISIDGCTPILLPDDLVLLLKQARAQVQVVDSQLDVVLSKACELQTSVDTNQTACDATPIEANSSTTINANGYYCLGTNMSGTLTIDGSDIVVDMNGHKVAGLAITNADQVRVFHGTVDGTGVLVSSATNITLEDLKANNATVGMDFEHVTGASVVNCDMSLNTTGVLAINSHKLVFDSCTASCNVSAGFSLVSSTTNCFNECKALSTGEGNTQTAGQEIFGFVSQDGYANIFENCIANGTQGLSVTDFDSLIAGFALRGSEGCTKIISCEAANSTASIASVNIPYGILLEGTIDSTLSLTGVPPIPSASGAQVVAWSLDQNYLAVGLDASPYIRVYEFDNVNRILTQVATPDISPGATVTSIDWSPDGTFLAVSGASITSDIIIYQFCKITQTLVRVQTAALLSSVASVNAIRWSPSGSYLVLGQAAGSEVQVLLFDRANYALTLAASSTTPSAAVTAVDWSPDETEVVVVYGTTVALFGFIPNTTTLTTHGTGTIGASPTAVRWSPDGDYIATGDSVGVETFQFNAGSSPTLTQRATSALANTKSVDWSDDGRYIVASHNAATALQVYQFDRTGSTTLESIATPGSPGTSTLSTVRWSPDGSLIALASDISGLNFALYDALSFPSKNVIKDNTVYCNSAGSFPTGIGISGSSVKNLIIQNTAYANPTTAPVIGTNYAFVQNVFNQLFGQGPSLLQNISVDGCVPMQAPADLVLISKQAQYKVGLLFSQLDVLVSVVENLSTVIDVVMECDPLPLSSSPISVAGFYCLDTDLAGGLSIESSNVTVDLNGHKISGGISFTGRDQITIYNGIVEGTGSVDGISAVSSTNINFHDLTVKNGLVGIDLDSVQGGLIENCTLTQNVTGIQLDTSHKICIQECTAACNTNAGFDLINSTTNVIQDCKALSTGDGNNNVLNQTVFGFVSADGYANIFERCIANSTQALSTTDAQSLVAGFALRGDEGCSKIIDCESANAQTNISGVTIPYGILLEAQFDGLVSITSEIVNNVSLNQQQTFSWSPDGKYLAVTLDTNNTTGTVAIYELNRIAGTLSQIVALADISARSIEWNPDGVYVAIGDSSSIAVYKFDQSVGSLTFVTSQTSGAANPSLSWSSDGTYLAAALFAGNLIQVYTFDRVAESLTPLVNASGNGPNSVALSPDDAYLAVAFFTDNVISVYPFDASVPSLGTSIDESGTGPRCVDWSPDGKYLAAAFATAGTVNVYEFDRSAQDLILRDSISGSTPRFVNWSADGNYLATLFTVGDLVQVYSFDRSTKMLTPVGNSASGDGPISLAFSPDGVNLAVAFANEELFTIYQALTFPHKNVIKDNTVYCNNGGNSPYGVGIYGSSIQNLIIGNTAYANPIMPAIVGSNYVFVLNVFNQALDFQPTLLQNISLDGCVPITPQEDVITIAKQIINKLDGVTSCPTTVISQSSFSGGSLNIAAAGNYCLSEPCTGDININAASVSLDLNENCLTGVIDITTDDVVVKNGTLTPALGATPAAITIESAADRAVIRDVVIINADGTSSGSPIAGRDGIEVIGSDAQIKNCTITGGAGESNTSGSGARGGDAIVVSGSAFRNVIRNCVLKGGDGGDAATSGTGGRGGHGIFVTTSAVDLVEISNCTIDKTGAGGAGAGGGQGGRGGDGVNIDNSATNVSAHNCTIRNTGAAGSGFTPVNVSQLDDFDQFVQLVSDDGGGKAIDDKVTAMISAIFANAADTISNANIKYNLKNRNVPAAQDPATGSGGLLVPNPPDQGNVVVNHVVNVVFDTQ